MRVAFALKEKRKFIFSCASDSQEELSKRILRSFYSWRGMQAKGSDKTLDDFMVGYKKVKITVEEIK